MGERQEREFNGRAFPADSSQGYQCSVPSSQCFHPHKEARRSEGEARRSEGEARRSKGEARSFEGEARRSEGEARRSEREARRSKREVRRSEREAKRSEREARRSERGETFHIPAFSAGQRTWTWVEGVLGVLTLHLWMAKSGTFSMHWTSLLSPSSGSLGLRRFH